ncbi:dipeptidase [Alkaliphilus peptidifermentans]|uniref:Membrane dipeptidase n=1 Tax=Alkaliphilus peptidifermentans DSM 18978 TaxID=1120976 RepID=A0A1G5KFJ6_9FIRM|nr:dipeptidase [Alkaliphilus peptidifermentans]SCY99164.1 membrane dipeptidase [Alkaliphilus peptidifermentans DSM 18978]
MKIIDLHCDTILRLYMDKCKYSLKDNPYHVDISKLLKGNSMAQFFALFVHLEEIKELGYKPYNSTIKLLDLFNQEIEKNSDTIRIAKNYTDLEANLADGKISAFLTIEEGGALEGSIENLKSFYRQGVRLITLTWNFPNEIGYPNYYEEFTNNGLTTFGIEVVEEMNRLGMLIDVSHLSDAGFYDVIKHSNKPIVASHSNARSIKDHSRNLTDDMIKALAEKGGVMGMNFCVDFLSDDNISRVEDIVAHIKHIYNTGGIDVVACGSDFDGIDSELEIKDFGEMDKLVIALAKKGFTEAEIEKICNGNAKRVIKEVLK